MADGAYGSDTKTKTLSKAEGEEIVKEARERLDQAWDKDRKNRQEMATDLRFLAGDQWPDSVKTERDLDGKPMLTINRMPQFLRQVTNPVRSADLSIKTAPVDDKSDPKLAEIFDGLLKQIQYQSSARAVYAACSEHQTACGIGWARVCTDYAHDDTFDQEISIEAIPNPLSVYDDPGAIQPDRCDSKWRIITEMMPRPAFKAKYSKAAEVGVDKPSDGLEGISWYTDDHVRIAEYWRMVPVEKTIALTDQGETIDLAKVPEWQQASLGIKQTRKVDAYDVEMYIISGSEVLEGPKPWAGKYLPQVPFIGSEIPVESGTYRHGVLRFLRDPQQLYNYYRTACAESIGAAPKAPFVATAKQIGKYQDQWATANRKNRAYLLYEADPLAPGPPKREPPPDTPAALIHEASAAVEDMNGVTGIYPASLGAQSNETSGIAISRRQIQGDAANYHYQDNYQRSLEYLGRVLVDIIPKVMDTERVIRILGDDDAETFVPINKAMIDPMTGQQTIVNDLSAGRFDIRVRIARSADTKRMETANSMMEFLKAFPAAAPLIGDLVAKNSDWPGAEEIAKRLHNTIPPEVLVDPDDPNTQPPASPNPMDDPVIKSEVDLRNAQAEKFHADTLVALAGIGASTDNPQEKLAPYETEQAAADLQKKIGDALAAHAKARKGTADAAKAEADAHKATADAHGAHIDNAATLEQLAKGWHPTQQKPVPKGFGDRVKSKSVH